jgi:predicted AAA+ superfamily ATPase
MLKRKIAKDLIEWKRRDDKLCLLVKGARQVGKTFIIDVCVNKCG